LYSPGTALLVDWQSNEVVEMKLVRGRVWKYGDDVNTDVIFPGKYTYTVTDPAEMASHAMEDLDPEFAKSVQPGDVVVAGRNFGCGSSREQAAFCLKYAGVGAVVAKSFSRIYFRNAINAGLPVIQAPEAVDAIEAGETVEIDLERGELRCKAGRFSFPRLPEAVLGIFAAGGLIPYTRQRLGLAPREGEGTGTSGESSR
jgi:3-isopropylmalate/(R)-2-methylmalate dehydratase small subunit